jgi:hypothetical protein
MAEFTGEMKSWLEANMKEYESFLLHGIFHNPMIRRSTLGVIAHSDMSESSSGLIVAALQVATGIHEEIGDELPYPPTLTQMMPHIRAAAATCDYNDDEIKEACRAVIALHDTDRCSTHVYVDPYFYAWFTTTRARRASRAALRSSVVDASAMITDLQADIDRASNAFSGGNDEMDEFYDSEDTPDVERTSTGIPGLDECMNGGYADGEAYLLFAGTGGGKSILAGQLALEAATRGKKVLIVSTELKVYEYFGRMTSAFLSIPINLLEKCKTLSSIRRVIASDVKHMRKLDEFDKLSAVLRKNLIIRKIDPDEAKTAAAALERETAFAEAKFGCKVDLELLDWLGALAEKTTQRAMTSSDRSAAWEVSALGVCRWASRRNVATFYLAQAVNDSEKHAVLGLGEIGLGKGIAKEAVMAIGITNRSDAQAIKAASLGKGEMPREKCLIDQLFCVAKARKGETLNIPVKREFRFQRFVERPR